MAIQVFKNCAIRTAIFFGLVSLYSREPQIKINIIRSEVTIMAKKKAAKSKGRAKAAKAVKAPKASVGMCSCGSGMKAADCCGC